MRAPARAPRRPGVKSALRALDMLEILAAASSALGVSEIARRLAIPKSSTSMLLKTLEQRGYVADQGERRFALHPSVRGGQNSWVGGPRARLVHLVQPVLERLTRITGETSLLAMRSDARNIEYVAKAVSPQDLRVDVELLVPRPIHVTSAGLAMLAHESTDAFENYLAQGPLVRMTRFTLWHPDKLRREMASIRARGYAVRHQSFALGDSGVAAPIFGADGVVAAALNVSAPTKRFKPRQADIAGKVLQAARQLSKALAAG
jgi:DNA-binding IclR family transcriptional regulator